MKPFQSKKLRAYTIIEISIVLLISAIVLAGSFSALKTGIKSSQIKSTSSNLDAVYQAIGRFLQKQSRLPCPAPLNASTDSSNSFGLEVAYISGSGTCSNASGGVFLSGTIAYGAVPIRSLGLSDNIGADGYGNKLIYVVESRLAAPQIPEALLPSNLSSSKSFGTLPDSQINIKISDIFPDNGQQQVFGNAALVLLSQGANMFGAYPLNGSVKYNASNSNSEQKNAFVGQGNPPEFFLSERTSGSVFDDVLIFKSRDQMAYEFGLKSIIACDGSTINSGLSSTIFPTTSKYYGSLVQGSSNCATPFQGMRATIRCQDFGKWGSVSLCPAVLSASPCTVPGPNDEILKNSIFLSSDPNSPGYSITKSGSTCYVWDVFSAGTTINDGSSQNRGVHSACSFMNGSLRLECQGGRIFANWP